MMKTMEEWNASDKDYGKFANPGDEVDEGIYYYFLGTVPPILMTKGGFLVGEATDTNEAGEYRYMHFHEANGKYFYIGLQTLKGIKEWEDHYD